jgi:hypothetical protein
LCRAADREAERVAARKFFHSDKDERALVAQLWERLHEAQREIASLKAALGKLRATAETERRRAEAAEDAHRRAIRVSLSAGGVSR